MISIIVVSRSITYLGIEINYDLRPKNQITSVCKKINVARHQIRNYVDLRQ